MRSFLGILSLRKSLYEFGGELWHIKQQRLKLRQIVEEVYSLEHKSFDSLAEAKRGLTVIQKDMAQDRVDVDFVVGCSAGTYENAVQAAFEACGEGVNLVFGGDHELADEMHDVDCAFFRSLTEEFFKERRSVATGVVALSVVLETIQVRDHTFHCFGFIVEELNLGGVGLLSTVHCLSLRKFGMFTSETHAEAAGKGNPEVFRPLS